MFYGGILFRIIGVVVTWGFLMLKSIVSRSKIRKFSEIWTGPDVEEELDMFNVIGNEFLQKVIGAITLIIITLLI